MTIGFALWDKVCGNVEDKYAISVFEKLVEMNTSKFLKLFDEITADTLYGAKKVREIVDSAIKTIDYSDFEKRVKDKNDKKMLILNSDFEEDELLDEAEYPQSFDNEYFKSLRSFAKRVNYCNQTLNRLGSGSSRIVYQIDDKTVLKLAKNSKGVAQNEREINMGTSNYYQSMDLFAEVYEYDENALWLEMQLARPAKKSDFKRIVGYDFSVICDYVQYVANLYLYRNKQRGINQSNKEFFESEVFEENYEYSFFNSLYDFLANEQIEAIGDFQRLSSYGVVQDNDGEKIVLIDYGLSDDIFKQYYSRR